MTDGHALNEHATIAWSEHDGVGLLELDRPEQRNGITNRMARELWERLSSLRARDDVKVVILTGRGSSFCPGADLAHYSSGGPDEPLRSEYFEAAVLLHELPQVTIAAINGACAGAGLGYALACDLRVAARGAKLNTAFLDVAVAGDMGIPWTLPRIVGAGVARELSFFPRKLTADEAAELGLVNAVVEPDELLAQVEGRAATLAGKAPLALRGMKANYLAAERTGFADYVALETERHRLICASADCREAFSAFVEKRTPRFEGR